MQKLHIPITIEQPPLIDEKPRNPFRFPRVAPSEQSAPVDPLNHVLYAGAENRQPTFVQRIKKMLVGHIVSCIVVGLITSFFSIQAAIKVILIVFSTIFLTGTGHKVIKEDHPPGKGIVATVKNSLEKFGEKAHDALHPPGGLIPKIAEPVKEVAKKAEEEVGKAKAVVTKTVVAVEEKADEVKDDVKKTIDGLGEKREVVARKVRAEAPKLQQPQSRANAQCPYCRHGLHIPPTRSKDVQCPSGRCQAIFNPKQALYLGPPGRRLF